MQHRRGSCTSDCGAHSDRRRGCGGNSSGDNDDSAIGGHELGEGRESEVPREAGRTSRLGGQGRVHRGEGPRHDEPDGAAGARRGGARAGCGEDGVEGQGAAAREGGREGGGGRDGRYGGAAERTGGACLLVFDYDQQEQKDGCAGDDDGCQCCAFPGGSRDNAMTLLDR